MSAAAHDDALLVDRCRGGDATAWADLVDRYARYVHAIARRAFGLAEAEAEDVFQEVFARAYERLGTLRDGGALRPWLGQLTRRCCVDALRARAREAAPAPADEIEAVDARMADIEEALVVRDALERLGAPCSELLDRFFCRDESYRTIGAALDLPAGTIASRISRCLGKLRAALGGGREETALAARQE